LPDAEPGLNKRESGFAEIQATIQVSRDIKFSDIFVVKKIIEDIGLPGHLKISIQHKFHLLYGF